MRTTKWLLLTLLIATAAHAQLASNLARGFDPEKVYQIGDLDNVNIFNGNLIIDIPIGPTYPVGGSLSYGFHLIYNGNPWDFKIVNELARAVPSRFNNVAMGWQFTMGELVAPHDPLNQSLGEDGNWVYAGPDGSERPFFPALHHEEETNSTYAAPANPAVGNVAGYTRDSSYLRLVRAADQTASGGCRNQYRVDFPDGTKHTFESVEQCLGGSDVGLANRYRLARIDDTFGNWVKVTYDADQPTTETVTDSTGRTHIIYHVNDPVFYEYAGTNEARNRVNQVNLAGPQGQTSTYYFDVELPTTTTVPCGDQTLVDTNRNVAVPFLRYVSRPDSLRYSMQDSQGNLYYWTSLSGANCASAHIKRMDLPTGGRIEYDAKTVRFPFIPDPRFRDTELNPDDPQLRSSAAFATTSIGVGTRKMFTNLTDTVPAVQWDYDYRLENTFPYTQTLTDGGSPPTKTRYIPQEEVVTVTDPARNTTAHYFDVFREELENWNLETCFPGGTYQEYGLPFTRRVSQNGRFLSSESFGNQCTDWVAAQSCPVPACKNGSTTLTAKKRTYVKYDRDGQLSTIPSDHWNLKNNSRLQSSGSEFVEAGGNTEVDGVSSDFDGLGHYRTEVMSSTITGTPTRTVTTHYNGNASAGSYVPGGNSNPALYMIMPSNPWLTSLYDRVDATENNHTARTEFGFDVATGFLLSRRTLKSGTDKGCNDLLAVFTGDHGNVGHEAYYGGDYRALGSSSPCATPTGTADYGITHTYLYGSLQKSQYDNTSSSLYFVNNDIDLNTGLVTTSRDTATLATTYTYDNMFRLKTEQQPDGVTTTLNYSMSPPSVTVDRSSASTPVLAKQRFYYDGLGRLIESKALMPGGWSTVVREYDSLSRLTSVSQPVFRTTDVSETLTGGDKTTFTYDYLGRKLTATSPDSTLAWQTYNGVTSMDRGAKDAAGTASPLGNTVTESYDGHGRLTKVTEKSGPTSATSAIGSDVGTNYAYDASNHLTSVKMGASTGPVQNRLFDYDGRGLLRWESQPESGITSYEYDARGHVRSKTQSAANSLFDQKFTFDPAERLTLVEGRNPYYDPANPYQPQFRPIKEFVYENNTNDGTNLRLGKLTRATRHNYGQQEFIDESEFEVSDAFEYRDVAGRKTKRITSITEVTGGVGGSRSPVRDIAMSVEYNDFDLPSKIYYPTCVNCGLPPTDPDRSSMTRTYDTGRLTALPGYVNSISYWPNGMRNVLQHTNGIADTQIVTNMQRPAQLSFGLYDRCVRPTFATQPASGQVSSSGGSYPLSVVVNGTGPFVYDWRRSTDYANVGTAPSITVNPTETTEYYVNVTGPCGHEMSEWAKVTINSCVTPSTGNIQAILQPDGSWILKPNPEVRPGPNAFTWTQPPSTSSLTHSETFAVRVLSTTTYRLTVADCGGSASGDVTITVPLPITTGLQATATGSNQISVTWPAISGATHYTVFRRSASPWNTIASTTSPSYTDTTVLSSTTYEYAVASDGGGTDYDVATTMTFTQAVAGQPITPAAVNDMLNAVNKVRAAVGWPAVTWSNILAPSDPLPEPGSLILARHILSCRARMNEALQALSVRTLPYANGDLAGAVVYASDINEVQQRSQ